MHLHGGLVPAASDGHPMQLIAPGGTFTYTYPNTQDAASLWYHDHAHGLSARTMFYGLAGSTSSRTRSRPRSGCPRGDFDVPLVIQDRAFNADGSLRYTENVDEGFMGDTIVVNGTVSPRFAVKRALYRLRFLNASNARAYRLSWNGGPMIQIAGDGGLLEAPVARNSIPLGRGRARRRLVDFRRLRAGAQVELTNGLGNGGTRRSCGSTWPAAAESGRLPAGLRPRERSRPGRGPPLGADALDQRRAPSGRSPGSGSTWTASTPARARHDRALAVRQPLAPAAPDAPARGPLPRARALDRHGARRRACAGRTR